MCGDPLPSDPGPWSRDCEGAGSGALHQNGSVHLEVILGLLRCIVSLTMLWSELVLGLVISGCSLACVIVPWSDRFT